MRLSSIRSIQQVLRDVEQMNLAGTFVDPKGSHVTVESFNTCPLYISGSAKDLDHLIGDAAAHLSGEILAETDVHGNVVAPVPLAGRLKNQSPGSLDLNLTFS